MRGPYQILLPLLGLFLVRVDLTDLFPVIIPVNILTVYDGDTVLAAKGSFRFKVRLSRIDAPEKAQNFINSSKNAGLLSKRCLQKHLPQTTRLEVYGMDMYGRILGDMEGVSLKLIQKGCVSLYPHAKFKSPGEKFLYVRSWQKAKKMKVGLWAFGGFEQPKAWRKKNLSRRRI